MVSTSGMIIIVIKMLEIGVFFLGFLCSDIFATEPSFDVPVVNITVVEGKTAILPCSVEHLGSHKVVWTDQWSTLLTFEIQRIIDDDRISVERPYTKDWNLLIHEVRYSDRGRYTCQINTDPIKTKNVVLYVLVPPRIIDEASTRDIVAREGETVTLVCNVTGVPTPTVHWYRRPLGQSLGVKERLEGRGRSSIGPCTYNRSGVGMNGEILIIYNVSRYCDGIYECMAFNDVSPAVNREIPVEVEFAPEIELPNKRIGQEPGRETMLECIITAFPQALSVWKRHGKEIKDTHKHRLEVYNEGDHRITLSLRIMDITAADYGNYTCYASNKLGNDIENMYMYDHKKTLRTTTPYPMTTPRRVTTGDYRYISGHNNGGTVIETQGPNPSGAAGNDKDTILADSPWSSGITCTGSLIVICEGPMQGRSMENHAVKTIEYASLPVLLCCAIILNRLTS
ncbi:limbic system-associated membrane protein-like isoform X3 [Mizuhopecten yessoensis]|uniref:limbic system-associated membrane protein-like isoform X3 n=1 Tax=Mizuhopecten yessoensis TaxID=6573 RepID=UPI000B45AF85|nr:limbic system-associated membrane protein-like isoform X3 [Mizuhopecten yessoensis]